MSDFEGLLTKHAPKDADGIFGVYVSVLNKSGEIVYSKGAGRVKFDSDQVPDENTAYWAFSWTKLLTTIAALQCVERGQIGLDDAIESVLPELKNAHIISKAPDDGFQLTPATKKITLRHLLNHTSGICYDARTPLIMQWRKSRGEGSMAFCGDVVKAFSMPLLFEPGENWAYGGGLDWAGQVVERLNNNIRLSDYLQENVFDLLGMTNTTFHIGKRPDIKERIMDNAFRAPNGKLIPTATMYPSDASTDSGGVGIVTTVKDFSLVLADLLKDSPVLLKKESVDLMFTPQFEPTSRASLGLMGMPYMHENLTGGEKSLGKLSFGLGGLLTLNQTPLLPPNTLTWGAMPNMEWFVNREKGIAALLGTQMMPPGDELSTNLIAEFIKKAWTFA